MKKSATTIILLLLSVLGWSAPGMADSVAVSAAVVSKNVCKFKNPTSAALAFGTLVPGITGDVTKQATLSFSCAGADPVALFAISDNNGLHAVGTNHRMRHLTDTSPSGYLPYTLNISPLSGSVGKNVEQVLTLTGSVHGNDYLTVVAGSYADTVTIQVQP